MVVVYSFDKFISSQIKKEVIKKLKKALGIFIFDFKQVFFYCKIVKKQKVSNIAHFLFKYVIKLLTHILLR